MKISNRELHKIKKKDEKFVHKFLWLKEGFQNFVSKNSLVKTSSIKQLKDHYRLIKVTRHNMLMPTFHSKDVYYKPSKEFKRSPKIFIILTVFRLDQGNNIFSIINIAENLALKTQNFKWHIVGDGPDKTEFIKRLKIKKLENFFKLFGHIEHGNKFKNILKSSDIFVDPYLPNGPGPNRAAWEALSLGLPLVGGSSCRKNYLIHEKHIYYANDDSSTGFSQAICDLIYDKKKRFIISKNASDIAKIRSLDYEVKRLVSILQSKLLLNCKTHPKR